MRRADEQTRPRGRAGAEAPSGGAADDPVLAAVRAGDEEAFAALAERHRRELQVHCYRMLGSIQDAEDLVQETFLRAWRARSGFTPHGAGSFRAWLYRIATNASLDALADRSRRLLPPQLGPAADPRAALRPPADLPWLQPYPDRLLDGIEQRGAAPDEAVVTKETIELAFLAAIQLLPPRQRAALIMRDVLGWSARETASLLQVSVASANSALQRGRATLKARLPARRLEWAPTSDPSLEERGLLQRYLDAYEHGDPTALAELLREDARLLMPPFLEWYDGRESIVAFAEPFMDPDSPHFRGRLRGVPTRANLQPAVAWYLPSPDDSTYRALSVDVLRIEGGQVAEIIGFVSPELFGAFGLPPTR